MATGHGEEAVLGPTPWEEHAHWWRTTFTRGADPEYELQLLPLLASHLGGCRRLLDIGTGEGQVVRHLIAADRRELVVGLEPAAAQITNARLAGGGPRYVRGAGEALPFPSASFDGVCCCLVIEHTVDPDALLAEAARVLAPGGRFVLLVNHPAFQGPDSGLVDDHILGERYWRVGPYLTEGVTVEEVDPGVRIAFSHRPLSRYVNPVAAAGCHLIAMEEPAPLPEFLAASVDAVLEAAIPRILLLVFSRLGP